MTNVRLVTTAETKALVDAPPEGLVFLDVRTPEEFNAGRIPGAIMIDVYDETFGDQVLALDPFKADSGAERSSTDNTVAR